MVGEVKGFCTLKSVETVMGFAGDPKELLDVLYLEIWDIAVDNSGFMVFSPKHNLLACVDMEDVKQYFFCGVVNDIIVPPNLSFFDGLLSAAARRNRKGGYGYIIKMMVIMNSLRKGELDERFLFQ